MAHRQVESRHIPLATSEALNAAKSVLSAKKGDKDCGWLCGRFPGERDLNTAGESDWCW